MPVATLINLIKSTLTGFLFGIALVNSGLQSVIASTDNKDASLLRQAPLYHAAVFVTTLYLCASATSALVIYVSNELGFTSLNPRKPSNYGWFRFDGNVIGGLMQGIGMVMVQSDPGLTFVSVGQGHRNACWTMVGGILGGLMFVISNEKLKKDQATNQPLSEKVNKSFASAQGSTIIKTGWLLFGFEVLVISVVLLLRQEIDESVTLGLSWTRAVRGGMLIGVAQIVSLVLTRGTLGVSSVYPAFANHLLRLLDSNRTDPGFSSLFFASGTVLSGSLSHIWGHDDERVISESSIDLRSSLVGGCLLIFGARLAGGCTSGHGLSGCGLLSTSSAVTMLSMTAGAILISQIRFQKLF